MDSNKAITYHRVESRSPNPYKLNRSVNSNIHSLSSSPPKFRSPHGIQKFQVSQSRKQANIELELINNRISQLIKFEQNAKKKIELAQKKAEQILKARERHEAELKDKELLKEIRRVEEEEIRRKNKEEKERRIANIESYKTSILHERKNNAEATKKKSEELDEMAKQYKLLIVKEKNCKKNLRYNEANEHKQKMGLAANTYSVALKEEYEQRILAEKASHLELIQKRKELEKHEAELINRLANTEQDQSEVLKNLETLAKVSLFHLGLRP